MVWPVKSRQRPTMHHAPCTTPKKKFLAPKKIFLTQKKNQLFHLFFWLDLILRPQSSECRTRSMRRRKHHHPRFLFFDKRLKDLFLSFMVHGLDLVPWCTVWPMQSRHRPIMRHAPGTTIITFVFRIFAALQALASSCPTLFSRLRCQGNFPRPFSVFLASRWFPLRLPSCSSTRSSLKWRIAR